MEKNTYNFLIKLEIFDHSANGKVFAEAPYGSAALVSLTSCYPYTVNKIDKLYPKILNQIQQKDLAIPIDFIIDQNELNRLNSDWLGSFLLMLTHILKVRIFRIRIHSRSNHPVVSAFFDIFDSQMKMHLKQKKSSKFCQKRVGFIDSGFVKTSPI